MGYFQDYQFNLTVSLRYENLHSKELEFFRDFFQKISNALYKATYQLHSIGKVRIVVNSFAATTADIYIESGFDIPYATNARLWFNNSPLVYSQYTSMNISILLHELGHYLYSLRDEYDEDGAKCINDLNQKACIMEYYAIKDHSRWVKNPIEYDASVDDEEIGYYSLSEFLNTFIDTDEGESASVFITDEFGGFGFCNPNNHKYDEEDHNHEQGEVSCWETMLNDGCHGGIGYWPEGLDLDYKDSKLIDTSTAPDIEWIELLPEERFVFVVQLSNDKNVEVFKGSLNAWIDTMNEGEKLEILSSGSSPSDNWGALYGQSDFNEIPGGNLEERKQSMKETLESLSSSESVLLEGIQSAYSLFENSLNLAANEVIALVVDDPNALDLDDLAEMIPDLITRGIRLFIYSFEDVEEELNNFVESTGGEVIKLSELIGQGVNLQSLMENLTNKSRDNVSIVPYNILNQKINEENKTTMIVYSLGFTEFSNNAHIVIRWDSEEYKQLNITLYKKQAGEIRHFSIKNSGYAHFKIPEVGREKWFLKIEAVVGFGKSKQENKTIRVLAMEYNPKVRVEFNVISNKIKNHGKITFRVESFYGSKLIADPSIDILIQFPSGKVQELTGLQSGVNKVHLIKGDKGDEKNGQYLFFVNVNYKGEKQIPAFSREKIVPVWELNNKKNKTKYKFRYGYNTKP